MDSEDGDDVWFSSLQFEGDVDNFSDWAYLISCVLKGSDCSTFTIIRELINRECDLDGMRVMHEWIGNAIRDIDNQKASDEASETRSEQ